MPPGPTAASEFRRGLNPYNLMVGAVAALALGAATLVATLAGVASDLFAASAPRRRRSPPRSACS